MSSEDSLRGKRIVVTGAAGGIGRVVAAELAHRGASLALVGRRARPLDVLMAELPGGPHDIHVLEVSREDRWRARRPELSPARKIDGLVTTAGVLGPIGRAGTWDLAEFRQTLDTNLLGTLVPILALLDDLVAGGGSIVTFSGGGATAPLRRYDAYAVSKAAVVRMTENLAEDLLESGVRINAIAPGFVATEMHRATLDAGPERVGPVYFDRTAKAVESGSGDSPELAAELTAFLVSDSSGGITGRLISARWDPWRDPAFQALLRSDPHLARLRRIDNQFFTTTGSH
jgi:NAD(P)-dependent dehydrogenase (short-subunit alcohol dehydrogenase family)